MTHIAAVPALDRDKCSHGFSPLSACTACIQACPHDALSLTRHGIDLDSSACTGCGSCVGLCPTRALAQEISPPPREGTSLILVCPRHPAAAQTPGPAPRCLHGYGLNELAGWVLDGIRVLACASGDCADCLERPETATLTDTLLQLNALAKARGLPALLMAKADKAELHRWSRQAGDAPAPRRRALLRAISAPLRTDDDAPPPLARLQSRGGDLYAFALMIDGQSCTGCDACIRICPEGALMRIKDADSNQHYHVEPEYCTGCLVCEDVCSDNAIRVEPMSAAPTDLPLSAMRCRACGVEMHLPAAAAAAGSGLCPVCARTGHHKKLFQVLT